MKNVVVWDVTPCGSSKNRRRRLLVTASVVPSSPILVTLMKEAQSSSETSVLTRATLRNIPEDTILHGIYCSETSERDWIFFGILQKGAALLMILKSNRILL
jgi:hypothetical protein